jgi:hypothetical protein
LFRMRFELANHTRFVGIPHDHEDEPSRGHIWYEQPPLFFLTLPVDLDL